MERFDVVIIGGGAAGMSAAQYAARAGLNAVVVERGATGGQCNLISDLENYPGFPTPITGEEFTERFQSQARAFGARFEYGEVSRILPHGRRYLIEMEDRRWEATTVIVATGAIHRTLGVAGEGAFTGRGVSYCATCDGPMFAGKRILVVGGGDAACDEATFLAKLTDRVVMVHRRDHFRAQAALARRVLDAPSITVRFNTEIDEIIGGPGEFGIDVVREVRLRDNRADTVSVEPFDAVFVFIGSTPQTDLVPFVTRDESGYVVTNERMESSSPGLYAVGDVRVTPFRQLVVAAADGAIAAHAAAQRIDTLAAEESQAVSGVAGS